MDIRNRIQGLRTIRAGDLRPNPRNWRLHLDEQRSALSRVLQSIGYISAVVARETPEGLELIDGHLRADLDPDAQIPVLVVDLDEHEANQAIATFDPLAAMAGKDQEILDGVIRELEDDTEWVSLLRDVELDSALLLPPEPAEETDETPPPPTEPVTQPGDLWVLGRHRLVCGDSTDPETVARVLDGEKPALMVTDPSYGVEYDADWRNRMDRANGTPYGARAVGKVMNDGRTDWSDAWALSPALVAYCWSPPGSSFVEHDAALREADFEPRITIIWAKNVAPIGRGHYHVKHEPCIYAVRKGATAAWIGDRKQTTLWEIDKPQKSETGHSTQKPLECMERPMRNHAGDVYEPFAGSGTTLIAAERQSRRCFAIELDPGYCDVIVERWESFTGEKARRE